MQNERSHLEQRTTLLQELTEDLARQVSGGQLRPAGIPEGGCCSPNNDTCDPGLVCHIIVGVNCGAPPMIGKCLYF